jgi:hypothetical protein
MKKQIKIRLPEKEKKSVYVIIILMIIFLASCQKEIPDRIEPMAPSSITFQKTYGGPNDEYIGNVRQTNDSGYVIIGATKSYGAGDDDIYVIKVNAQGSIQWTKTYGTQYADEGYNIKQTKDGGYILSGTAGGSGSFILIKTDAGGNKQWTRSYGYFGWGYGNDYDIQLIDDGGYMLAGPTDYQDGTLCIRTDENGNILWCKIYKGGNGGGSMAKTADGGYAIVSQRDIGYVIPPGTQLIKIDANGNLLWTKLYSVGSGTSNPASMKKTADGSFLITGMYIGAGNNNTWDVYVIKTDANGNLKWFKTYAGTNFDGAWDIEETTDGGYMFSGTTGKYQDGNVLLIKTDTSGKVTWSKMFGGGKESYSYVRQAKDKGFIIASYTSAFGAGSSDIYLIKTDNSGNAGCYENPFTPTVTSLAVQETTPYIDISIGSIFFTVNLAIGTGGIETTLCHN